MVFRSWKSRVCKSYMAEWFLNRLNPNSCSFLTGHFKWPFNQNKPLYITKSKWCHSVALHLTRLRTNWSLMYATISKCVRSLSTCVGFPFHDVGFIFPRVGSGRSQPPWLGLQKRKKKQKNCRSVGSQHHLEECQKGSCYECSDLYRVPVLIKIS